MKRSKCLLLLVCLLLGTARAQTTPMPVVPRDTDPTITDPNFPHYCWTPIEEPRGLLLVYLPGTGNKPRPGLPLADEAAQLGYHVIDLSYPDGLAAQVACGKDPDPQAHMRFRLAIIHGGQATRKKRIAPSDGVENRLGKLLAYLSREHPDQHWEQFLDSQRQPLWDKIAFAGGSQGGGHAYVLGKIHKVARVLMFSSPKDFSFHFNAPPQGFDDHTATPLSRFFAFNHVEDNGNGCNHDQQTRTLQQIKLTDLGVASVDDQEAPFDHAHVLYTNAKAAVPHHASLSPRWRRVWRYMLLEGAE